VRDRSNVQYCTDALRITVGTEQENTQLVDALADYMDLMASQNA
jgi:histidinol-phosphate aminotransferase